LVTFSKAGHIPKGYLPNNQFIKLRPDRGILSATEQSSGSATWPNGQATYIALRFGNEKQAEGWFSFRSSQSRFYPDLPNPELYQDILTYSIPNADSYQIQCGYVLQDFRCISDIRYEEFYIFFSGSIGINEMSNQNFLDLIDYIDTRMGDLLNSRE